jgi:tetratricopeptide (TPR) repeat protein
MGSWPEEEADPQTKSQDSAQGLVRVRRPALTPWQSLGYSLFFTLFFVGLIGSFIYMRGQTNPDAIRNKAWRAFDNGQYDIAITYSSELILIQSTNVDGYRIRGRALIEKKEYDRATDDFSQAIRLSPRYSLDYRDRGYCYECLKEYHRALSDYDQVIALEPKWPEGYFDRGIVYAHLKEYDKAIADYNRAILFGRNFAAAYRNLGRTYYFQKNYERALADINEAIRLDRKDDLAYVNRGLVYSAKKEFEKAIADYQNSIQLNAESHEGYDELAWLLATCSDGKLRNGMKAVEHATKACELILWKEPDYLQTLAAAYAEAGNFEEAVKWQKKSLEFPDDDAAHVDRARARLKLYEDGKPYRDEEP